MSQRMMTMFGAVFLLAAGCRSRVDVAKETQVLLEADRAWANLAAAGRNPDSVLAYWTDDARVVMAGQPTLQGKSAIRQMVTSSMATPGFHLVWVPETAVVSQSGDLGYTIGTNEFTIPDSTGKTTKIAGRYLTVWRNEPDGRWRCVLDYSTPSPVEAAAEK